MEATERPPLRGLPWLFALESNGLRIINLAILAALASIALSHITYHGSYAALPIILIGVECVLYIISIINCIPTPKYSVKN